MKKGTRLFLEGSNQITDNRVTKTKRDKIHENNSSAVIISSTLYNPYNYANQPTGYSSDTALFTTAEKYIGSINTAITGTVVNNYYIADAHAMFYSTYGNGNMGTVNFFYPKYSALTWWFVKSTRDTHFNQTGQDQMRDLHTNLYDSILQSTSMLPQIAA